MRSASSGWPIPPACGATCNHPPVERSAVPRPIIAAICIGFVALVTACGDDGRTLAPAPTVAVEPATTTTSTAPGAPAAIGLTLTSPAFDEGGTIGESFTCNGLDVPPPLVFSGVPAQAAGLAVVVTDRDAGGYVHWVVAGLPVTITRLESGVIPPEAVTALADSGVAGWDGPCPPTDDDPHAYEFVVHALSEPIGLAPGLDGADAIALIEQASLASDVLVGFYP